MELILARDAKADASNAVDDCWAEVLDAEQYENEMEIELHQICPEDDMVFDDEDHDAEYQQQAAVLDAAKESTAEANSRHKQAKDDLKQANQALKKLEENHKKYGKVNQDLWMTIQRKLNKDYNVHISSYHGVEIWRATNADGCFARQRLSWKI